MFIYCICTQYLVGAPFALITASMRRGMEVISLWHCWGGMEAQVSLTVAFSSSAFFGLLFLIFLLTIPRRFSIGFRSGEFAGQSITPTPWSLNQLLVLLAVWAGAKSCWKMKSGTLKSWSAEGCMKCFSTLPPDSGTLVSKWNTKLALIWKEDFGPLGNSPVLLLLSPGKTPLTTTVAKFLDTSVCGALDALTPASVHSLWSSPKFLNRMLDNPHKAAVLSVSCASFFLFHNLSWITKNKWTFPLSNLKLLIIIIIDNNSIIIELNIIN